MRVLLASVAALCILHTAQAFPCPFNEHDCDCTGGDPKGTKFESAVCNRCSFSSPISTYTITGQLLMKEQYDPHANHFVTFKSIGHLTVTYPRPYSVFRPDSLAFVGPRVTNFSLYNYDRIVPLAEAVNVLGRNDLRGLLLENADYMSLAAGTFKDFGSLRALTIDGTKITAIDDDAFTGLGSTLVELALTRAALQTYPAKALKDLTKLKRLDLSGNGQQTFPDSAFAGLVNLEELNLGGNNIAAAVDAGAFNNFPSACASVYLDNSSLKVTPTSAVAQLTNVTYLSLTNNQIASIRSGDFPAGTNLNLLKLNRNPLVNIKIGAFKTLNLLEELHLEQTELAFVDLAVLNGMEKLQYVALDGNEKLVTLSVSSGKVPSSLKRVTISNSGIQDLDPELEAILERPDFELLDLSNNKGLSCDRDLVWLAKFVLCTPARARVSDSYCGNDPKKSVEDFLRESSPVACPTSIVTTAVPADSKLTVLPRKGMRPAVAPMPQA